MRLIQSLQHAPSPQLESSNHRRKTCTTRTTRFCFRTRDSLVLWEEACLSENKRRDLIRGQGILVGTVQQLARILRERQSCWLVNPTTTETTTPSSTNFFHSVIGCASDGEHGGKCSMARCSSPAFKDALCRLFFLPCCFQANASNTQAHNGLAVVEASSHSCGNGPTQAGRKRWPKRSPSSCNFTAQVVQDGAQKAKTRPKQEEKSCRGIVSEYE